MVKFVVQKGIDSGTGGANAQGQLIKAIYPARLNHTR
jgi:hypothetical protein